MIFKNKNKLLLVILFLIMIILILVGFLITDKKGKTEYEEIKLKFESRTVMLDAFDSGNYYKFGWLQVQGTNMDLTNHMNT